MVPLSSPTSSSCSYQRSRSATSVRTHKISGVREAIEAAGATQRFLPAYSPDLNPIENLYSKVKSDLRKGAARTVDALSRLVGRSLKAIAPSECAGYFRHAGYRV